MSRTYIVTYKDYPEGLDYDMTFFDAEVVADTIGEAVEIVEDECMPAGGVTSVTVIKGADYH